MKATPHCIDYLGEVEILVNCQLLHYQNNECQVGVSKVHLTICVRNVSTCDFGKISVQVTK